MKEIYITFKIYIQQLIENKSMFLGYISFSALIAITYSLSLSPLYSASSSFIANENWRDWWNEGNSFIDSYSAYTKELKIRENNNKIKQVFKGDELIMSFLESGVFDEESYYSDYHKNKIDTLTKFKLSLSVGLNDETGIFRITLKDKTKLQAEKNLNKYLKFVNVLLIKDSLKIIYDDIEYLYSIDRVDNTKYLNLTIDKIIEEKIISAKLMNIDMYPPVNVITPAYSSVYRWYPKRRSTVMSLFAISIFIFIIFFIKPQPNFDRLMF